MKRGLRQLPLFLTHRHGYAEEGYILFQIVKKLVTEYVCTYVGLSNGYIYDYVSNTDRSYRIRVTRDWTKNVCHTHTYEKLESLSMKKLIKLHV